MPHRGSLGFLDGGAALPVVLFVCPFVLLLLAGGVVRRRWRLAAARREEVMRLAALAAEEADAARAEEEEAAAVAYAAISLGQRQPRLTQCAFCFSPTTTRCSRCKAVRYCSRKCQITHWRQGHKEDCHPPQIDDHRLEELHSTDLKQMQAEQSDLRNQSLNYEGELQKKKVKTSFERSYSQSNFSSDCFNEDDFLGTSGTESTDSSTNLSTSSSFTVSGEASDDASTCDDEKGLNDAKMSESSSGTEVHSTSVKEVLQCKSFNVISSVDNFSCTSKQNNSSGRSRTLDTEVGAPFPSKFTTDDCTDRKTSEYAGECQDAGIDTGVAQIARSDNSVDSQYSRDNYYNQSDDRSHFDISSKWTNHAVSPETRSRNFSNNSVLSESTQPDSTGLSAMGYSKTGCAASGRSSDILFVHSKKLKSLASASSANRASSIGGRHSVLHDTSSKIDNPSGTPRLSEIMSLETNDSNNSKISLRRVIQQLKPSKILRHYSSSLEDDESKMLFPYDYFVKLYKYDLAEMRPSGLTNCGNSCYANAVLQCLAFTPPLTAYLLQGLHSTTCPKGEWCFTCELESLVRQAKQGHSPLSTISILSHIHDIGIHLGHGREEDAHEFLRYAIDAMQSVCLKEAGAYAVGKMTEETTLIQLTFGGYLRSKIRCMRCQGKSERNERMMDLTVEIHGNIRTLEEALKQFTTTETLEGENKYHCSRCKSYERAKKKLTVLDAPNILTIVLKRFQFGKYGKLNKAVRFPEYLDLAPYMSGTDDKLLYRLYAVVVHLDVMNASFSGHYICYVSSTLGKWYKADDSTVKPVELEKVLSQNAYMLLYARCTPRAPSLIRNAKPLCQLKEKNSRWKEESSSGADAEKARSHPMILCRNSARCPTSQVQLHLPTSHSFSYEPLNNFKERFELPRTDSSSDNSSLFSYSDEGSWSTESTRNSTSTEYSEYIFGGIGS